MTGVDASRAIVAPGDRSARATEILAIATELFARDGYHAVGMRAVALEVGIRTSSLYHHFPSKEAILYEIALEVTKDFVESHIGMLDGPAPIPDRLVALLRAHIVYFWLRRQEFDVALREVNELAPDHYEEVQGHRRRYQRRIRAVIAEGLDAGLFSVADPGVATLALLDMINGIHRWFRPEQGTIEDLAEQYVGLVMSLLRAGGNGRSR